MEIFKVATNLSFTSEFPFLIFRYKKISIQIGMAYVSKATNLQQFYDFSDITDDVEHSEFIVQREKNHVSVHGSMVRNSIWKTIDLILRMFSRTLESSRTRAKQMACKCIAKRRTVRLT